MFENKLNSYKEIINSGLKKFLLRFENKDSVTVFKAMEYSLLAGGKLLRPVLTLAVCDMLGGNCENAVAFACAVEFIHVGSLIHDDLPCMDDDDQRRGKDSCHIKFNEAAAVLAGDSLFSSAFEILTYGSEYGLKYETIVKAVVLLSNMFGTKGIVTGQDMDMFIEEENFKKSTIEKVAIYKTCSLIKAACGLGAIAANVDKKEIEIIYKFAMHFGLCFQICDDLLDYDENFSSSVKKPNFLSVYSLEEAKKEAKEEAKKAILCLEKLENSDFLIELTKFALAREK